MRSFLRMCLAVLFFAIAVAVPRNAAAEDSPSANHVKMSTVPRLCLEQGSALVGNVKYDCKEYAEDDVYNTLEERPFKKTVYAATKQVMRDEPPVENLGLVVKQDTRVTKTVETSIAEEKKQVAVVQEKPKPPQYRFKYAEKK